MSNSYSLYTTLQDEWIDSVPSHWDFTKIIRFSKLKTGGTPNKQNLSFWKDGTISWMTSGEVNKKIVFSTEQKITEQGMKNSNANLLPINSVMVALNGQGKTKGMAAVLKIPATCNQSLASFICDELFLHYKYLYYYLESNYKNLRGLVGDDLRDGLSLSKLKEIKIPIPTFSEQFIISSFLDKKTAQIDSLIEKKKRLIELLKEYRTAIINHAVTKGLDPNAKMKDSGIEWIGEIPEHWEVRKGKFLFSITSGIAPDSLKFNEEGRSYYIKVDDLNDGKPTLNLEKRGLKFDSTEMSVYPPDLIIFPKRGAAIFTNKIKITRFECMIDTNLMGLRIFPRITDEKFIAYCLSARRLNDIADTSTIPQINNKHIYPLEFPYPPYEEQLRIIRQIETQQLKTDRLINNELRNIELLEEYRTSLISDAVTGKIDVRDYAERVSEPGAI